MTESQIKRHTTKQELIERVKALESLETCERVFRVMPLPKGSFAAITAIESLKPFITIEELEGLT